MFGLIFNYFIRRRWSGWWHTYNYITAAGLDSGLILSTIVIFFAITLPNVSIPQWWGNVAPFETMVRNYIRACTNVGPNEKHRTIFTLPFERLSTLVKPLDQPNGSIEHESIFSHLILIFWQYQSRSTVYLSTKYIYSIHVILTNG
jgi:hypothetical protein